MSKPASFSASISSRFWLWCGQRGWKPALPLLLGLALAGCVSLETSAPSVARLPRGGSPGVLERGREIYVGQCTTCHSVQPVAKYSASEWPGIAQDMSERSKLSAQDAQAILAYVLAARQMPAVR